MSHQFNYPNVEEQELRVIQNAVEHTVDPWPKLDIDFPLDPRLQYSPTNASCFDLPPENYITAYSFENWMPGEAHASAPNHEHQHPLDNSQTTSGGVGGTGMSDLGTPNPIPSSVMSSAIGTNAITPELSTSVSSGMTRPVTSTGTLGDHGEEKFPFVCGLCHDCYTRRYTVKRHFPECVKKHGNDGNLAWDSHPSCKQGRAYKPRGSNRWNRRGRDST